MAQGQVESVEDVHQVDFSRADDGDEDLVLHTALHYAFSKGLAQLFVESVEPDKQRDFILTGDENQWTALHMAAAHGRTEVVEYLCSVPLPGSELILKKNNEGKTALHYAKSKEIAQVLVESVELHKKYDFMVTADRNSNYTALHTATFLGQTDIVAYLCNISQSNDGLMLKKDKWGQTALYYAESKEIAQLIVESVEPGKRRDILLAVDENQWTALHRAVIQDRTEVVEYLCSVPLPDSELILKKEKYGQTALHYANNKEIAQLLVESIEPHKQKDFISTVDEKHWTALHMAAMQAKADVVKYLCSIQPISDHFQHVETATSGNVLHKAASGEIVDIVLESISSDNSMSTDSIVKLLQTTDTEGNTVVLSLSQLGRADSLGQVLDYIEQTLSTDLYKEIFQKTNSKRQNVLHLAAISPAMNSLYDTLQDYMPDIDLNSMILSTDIYNNTPIHYATAKYDSKVFADFILRLSWQERSNIARSRNIQKTDCNSIIHQQSFSETYYLQKVLCDTLTQKYSDRFSIAADLSIFARDDIRHQLRYPEQYYKPNEIIIKVLKYALNEYSLLDSAFTTSHTLFSSAVLTQLANRRSTQRGLITTTTVEPDSLCIHIDYDEIEEPKQENIQKILNGMDAIELHGKPKIAVVECRLLADSLNLVAPNPDYLILTVKYFTTCYKKRKVELNKYESTDDLINEFRQDAEVEKVCVNSSLSKRYLREEKGVVKTIDTNSSIVDTRLSNADTGLSNAEKASIERKLDTPVSITRPKRGKALIICNQLLYEIQPEMTPKEIAKLAQTAENRKKSLANARSVFSSHFRLHVEEKTNLTASEIKRSISEFSHSEDHGSLVALAIFSHGFERKISGADSNSECSVQEVVDSLRGGKIDNIPKILFLSFCQGKLPPQFNRVAHNFESSSDFPWPENEIGMTLKPIRQQLSLKAREAEWRRTEFPSLEVPVDCYICFSTLPDSKSKQGLMFEMLVKHLSEISKSEATDGTLPLGGRSEQGSGTASTVTACQPHSRVELVRLLTDVAGQIREKSRSTQYSNIYYTLNRNSRKIFIDIL